MYLILKDSRPHSFLFITSFHNNDLHLKLNEIYYRYRKFVFKCLLFDKRSFYDNLITKSVNN